MFYLQNLRVRLQERRSRLHRAGHQSYHDELQYFLQFLDENPYIRSLLNVLDANPSADIDEWKAQIQHVGLIPSFADTEEGRAKICHQILQRCKATQTGGELDEWVWTFSGANRVDDKVREFTEKVIDPFVNFLHDRIDDAGNVLFVIGRYKFQVEWFKQEELYNLYKSNTRFGEGNLDRNLRAALFEGGVDYPFSQPASPSGQADVVALLGSTDPLVLEVKVFDPEMSRNTGHLSQGFHQVIRYANDYNQNLGYLVIFNCSGRQLIVDPQESSEQPFPPRFNHGGKIYFVISIDVNPDTLSASRERPESRVTITLEDLLASRDDNPSYTE